MLVFLGPMVQYRCPLTEGYALGRLVVNDTRLERDIWHGGHDLQAMHRLCVEDRRFFWFNWIGVRVRIAVAISESRSNVTALALFGQ